MIIEEFNAAPTSRVRPYHAQKHENKKEVSEILDELPLLKSIIKRLERRIEATDSVKQALTIATQYKITREQALIILDIVRTQIETEKGWLLSKLDKVR